MQFKNVVFIVILVAYTGYYVGVSKGFIKKDPHNENDDQDRSAIQRVVDAITPDSPEEKRLKKGEKLDVLYQHLKVAQINYDSYDKWRSDALANPPTWPAAREQLWAELQNDKRPELQAEVDKYRKLIAELEGK